VIAATWATVARRVAAGERAYPCPGLAPFFLSAAVEAASSQHVCTPSRCGARVTADGPRHGSVDRPCANPIPATTHVRFAALLVTAGARRASDHARSDSVCTCFNDATNQSGARLRDRHTEPYVVDFIHVFFRRPAPWRAFPGSRPDASRAGCRSDACGPGTMGADDTRGAPSDRPEARGSPAAPSTIDGSLRMGGAAAPAGVRSLRVLRRATLPRAPAGDAQGPPVAVPAPCDRARRELRVPGISAARRTVAVRAELAASPFTESSCPAPLFCEC
jgi:hypothetical protein